MPWSQPPTSDAVTWRSVAVSCMIPLILAGAFLAYYPFVVRREEAKLARLFPEDYERYIKQVPRLIPRSLRIREPDCYEVRPVVFRKHLGSALWFVWLVGVLELVEACHELQVLPVWWRLS